MTATEIALLIAVAVAGIAALVDLCRETWDKTELQGPDRRDLRNVRWP